MLKIKVIADNILNLTDARYFAAYGVDYLIFNMSNISHTTIKEIKEWVEGVKILLDLSENLTPTLLDFIISVSPAGFVSSKTEVLEDIEKQLPGAEFFLRTPQDELLSVEKENRNKKLFVRTDSTVASVEKAIASEGITGIIVEGEPEEKIGFKNFDQLDEIFDVLAIEI